MRWRVEIERRLRAVVEVEAPDSERARQAASLLAEADECTDTREFSWPPDTKVAIYAAVQQQLGEPWCHGGAWYDGPGDVIGVDRSLGNRFTQEDVDLLRSRIEAHGCTVVDDWNGAGCDTVSFQCDWPGKGPIVDKGRGTVDPSKRPVLDRQKICAPREKP